MDKLFTPTTFPPWQFYVLGCRGSWSVSGEEYLEFGGDTSCYLIKRGDYAIVLDCGTGLHRAAPLLKDCNHIDVLLTHVHYDHVSGLLNFGVFPSHAQLRFFAAFDNWFGRDTVARFFAPPFWPHIPDLGQMITVPRDGPAKLLHGVSALFRPSNHPNGACMIRLEGPDWCVCCASDYEHTAPFPSDFIRGCTLLLYDAKYTDEEYPAYTGWGHSTWQAGCDLARQYEVPNLVLIHHAPEKDDDTLRSIEQQAQARFSRVRLARAGDMYELTPSTPQGEYRSDKHEY